MPRIPSFSFNLYAITNGSSFTRADRLIFKRRRTAHRLANGSVCSSPLPSLQGATNTDVRGEAEMRQHELRIVKHIASHRFARRREISAYPGH